MPKMSELRLNKYPLNSIQPPVSDPAGKIFSWEHDSFNIDLFYQPIHLFGQALFIKFGD